MNRELPKPIQEALASQTAGDVHPSADSLTAFVEHSLPQRESQRITDHLAQCADCREVVFLASNALEEPVGEEQELMPADAVRRISPALLAKAGEAPAKASRRRGWKLWWVWAPAVAAVLVVSGVVFQQRFFQRGSEPMTMAIKAPPPAANSAQETAPLASARESLGQPAVEYQTTLESQKPTGKLARARTDQKQPAGNVKESVI